MRSKATSLKLKELTAMLPTFEGKTVDIWMNGVLQQWWTDRKVQAIDGRYLIIEAKEGERAVKGQHWIDVRSINKIQIHNTK